MKLKLRRALSGFSISSEIAYLSVLRDVGPLTRALGAVHMHVIGRLHWIFSAFVSHRRSGKGIFYWALVARMYMYIVYRGR